MRPKPIALNCPEAYHIEHLHRSGYTAKQIAEAIGRNYSWIRKAMNGRYGSRTLSRLVGVLPICNMTFVNCPEAYHIAYLHSQGMGCCLIADSTGRNADWLDKSFRAAPGYQRLSSFVGVLSTGKRPAKLLARSWEVSR